MFLLFFILSDERTYQSLIDMAGDTLDVLPPSPNKSNNYDPYPPPQQGLVERDGMSPPAIVPHNGGRPPPAKLHEKLSGGSPGDSPLISPFPHGVNASQYNRSISPIERGVLPTPYNAPFFSPPANFKSDMTVIAGFQQQLATPNLLPTPEPTPGLFPIPTYAPQHGQMNISEFPLDNAPRHIPVLMGGQAQLSESPVKKPVPAPRNLPAQSMSFTT